MHIISLACLLWLASLSSAFAADSQFRVVPVNPEASSLTGATFELLYRLKLPDETGLIGIDPQGGALVSEPSPRKTNGYALRKYTRRGRLQWTWPGVQWDEGTPQAWWDDRGRTYFIADDGLECIGPDGTRRWLAKPGDGIQLALTPDGAVVLKDEYLGLSAYSPSGKLRWEQRLGIYADCTPFGDIFVATNGTIFAEGGQHGVFGLAPSGKRLWRATNISCTSSACSGNVLYVVHRDPPWSSGEPPASLSLKAVDTRGRLVWERPLPTGEDWPGLAADDHGHVLYTQQASAILFNKRGDVVYKVFGGAEQVSEEYDRGWSSWLLPNGVAMLATVEGSPSKPNYMLRCIAPDGRVIKEKNVYRDWNGPMEINGYCATLPTGAGCEVFRIDCR